MSIFSTDFEFLVSRNERFCRLEQLELPERLDLFEQLELSELFELFDCSNLLRTNLNRFECWYFEPNTEQFKIFRIHAHP